MTPFCFGDIITSPKLRLASTLSLSGQIGIEEHLRLPGRSGGPKTQSGINGYREASMLTDEEVASLAKELLKESIDQVLTWDPDYFHEIYEMDEGELVPVYGATSVEGYGSFLCEYMPLEVIKKIIRDSERIFDEFEIVSSDKKSGLEKKEGGLVKFLVTSARHQLGSWQAQRL